MQVQTVSKADIHTDSYSYAEQVYALNNYCHVIPTLFSVRWRQS